MKESRVKDDNYVVIQGWMIKDLNLKGNELITFGIIYGYSQDEDSCFNGSLQYLADWTNSTKQGIMKVLKKLEEKNLIIKINQGKYKPNLYKINHETIQQSRLCNKVDYETKFNTSMKQSLTGYETKFNTSMKQSLPNNIIYNLDDNIVNNIECQSQPKKKNDILEKIESENISQELKNKLLEFVEFRKEIKKPLKTYRSIQAMLNKIGKDFINEYHLIESIDESIMNEYQGVFPKKINFKKGNIEQESYVTRRLRELEGGVM